MTIMKHTYRYILLCIMAGILAGGCHRHPYYDLEDPEAGSIRILFDWDGYMDIPPGMNLMFYPVVDENRTHGNYTGNPIPCQLQYDGGKISLPAGTYNVAIYNDYTYNILYRGMESFFTAEAYLGDNNRQPLASRLATGRNVAEPDIFYVAQIIGLDIKPQEGERTIIVRPELKTLKLFVHVELKGVQYISMADGGITGAAGGILLSTGGTKGEECNRLFPFSINDEGLYAHTTLFLMDNPTTRQYTLELAFLLRNNTVSMGKFVYDVTEQIVSQLNKHEGNIPPEGIHIYIKEVEIDEVDTSGGFDVIVDGWGDEINIELK